MKKCTKCGVEKSESEFSKQRRAKNGLQSHCKDCYRTYARANKAAIAAYQTAYATKHAVELRAYKTAYYKGNRGELLAQGAVYREQNRNTILAQKARRYVRTTITCAVPVVDCAENALEVYCACVVILRWECWLTAPKQSTELPTTYDDGRIRKV